MFKVIYLFCERFNNSSNNSSSVGTGVVLYDFLPVNLMALILGMAAIKCLHKWPFIRGFFSTGILPFELITEEESWAVKATSTLNVKYSQEQWHQTLSSIMFLLSPYSRKVMTLALPEPFGSRALI